MKNTTNEEDEGRKIDKLMEVIHYITNDTQGLGHTQLVKLAYLIDRRFYENNKEELTDIDYFMYFYGPYCDEFKEALAKLQFDNLIREEFSGQGYKVFLNGEMDYKLNDMEKEVIDEVLKFAKENELLKSANSIKEYIYGLPEFNNIDFLVPINFDKINFIKENIDVHD